MWTGWGWIEMLAGAGGDRFKLHGDGWRWDWNPVPHADL